MEFLASRLCLREQADAGNVSNVGKGPGLNRVASIPSHLPPSPHAPLFRYAAGSPRKVAQAGNVANLEFSVGPVIFTRPPVAKCSMLKSRAEVRQEEGFETETKDKEDFGLGGKKGETGGVMVMELDCAWPDKSSIPPGNVLRNIDAGIIVEQVIPCCPEV